MTIQELEQIERDLTAKIRANLGKGSVSALVLKLREVRHRLFFERATEATPKQ